MKPVQVAKAALTRSRTLAWLLRSHQGGPGLRILLYHRIADDRRDPLALPVSRFREQMALLAAEGYVATDAATALEQLYDDTLGPRTVALTFDDAFEIREHVLPELSARGFGATIFVVSDVAAGNATFHWYKSQPPVLTWEQVARLDRTSTLRFEPHTLTHPNLTALESTASRREMFESKAETERRLGREAKLFCYPGGFFGPRERQFAAEAGYRFALSCEPGLNCVDTDRFAIRRIQIDRTDSLLDFRAKVEGSHDRPLMGRRLYRRLFLGAADPLARRRGTTVEAGR